jgi:hypothetical protein
MTYHFGIIYAIFSDKLLTTLEHGGESGIRTHDTVSRIHAFQACAFSHSAISPVGNWGGTMGSTWRAFLRTQPRVQVYRTAINQRFYLAFV